MGSGVGGGEEDIAQLGSRRLVLRIPSHAEVAENSRPQAPPSFFRSSGGGSTRSSAAENGLASNSASQQQQERVGGASSFVRQTEFYNPPPSAPAPACALFAPLSSSGGGSRGGDGSRLQEAPLPTVPSQARNAILVSRRQQGNPVLKYIRNVRWVYGDIIPDYVLGQTTCALYISLRYHLLHPDYLFFRIREVQKGFRLRVVLCHVDLEDVIKALDEVIKTALLHDFSLLCAWSLEECARYLETLKTYENKPADNIQERTDNDHLSRMTSALTTVRHVNKTDVLTLGSTFETVAGIFGASMDDLARCPGIGEKKVKRLYDAFHEPFRRTTKQLRLDDVLVMLNQGADVELNTSVHSIINEADATGTTVVDASESNADEPKLSVRKASGAAHAKGVKPKGDAQTDTYERFEH